MGIRIIVAIAIIVPLMAATGFRAEWWQTFAIAFLGFGAGHLAELWWKSRKSHDDD